MSSYENLSTSQKSPNESFSFHSGLYNISGVSAVNSVLTVRNPAENAAALTITPIAGETRPVSLRQT